MGLACQHCPKCVHTQLCRDRLGHNVAPKLERVPGVGREARQREQTLPRLQECLHRPLRVRKCLGLQLWLGGCNCTQEGRAPAPSTWKWAGLLPVPGSCSFVESTSSSLTSHTAAGIMAVSIPDGLLLPSLPCSWWHYFQ